MKLQFTDLHLQLTQDTAQLVTDAVANTISEHA